MAVKIWTPGRIENRLPKFRKSSTNPGASYVYDPEAAVYLEVFPDGIVHPIEPGVNPAQAAFERAQRQESVVLISPYDSPGITVLVDEPDRLSAE